MKGAVSSCEVVCAGSPWGPNTVLNEEGRLAEYDATAQLFAVNGVLAVISLMLTLRWTTHLFNTFSKYAWVGVTKFVDV